MDVKARKKKKDLYANINILFFLNITLKYNK